MGLVPAKIEGFSWFIANLSWPGRGRRAGRNRRAGCIRGRRGPAGMILVPRPLRGVGIMAAGGVEKESAKHPGAVLRQAAGGAGERSLIVLIGANARFPSVLHQNDGAGKPPPDPSAHARAPKPFHRPPAKNALKAICYSRRRTLYAD